MSIPVTSTPSSILPEELKRIQEIQSNYSSLIRRYGELYYQNKFIVAEMQEIDNEMINLENTRIEVMTTLQKKYGAGSIDVTNGTFIPVPVTT